MVLENHFRIALSTLLLSEREDETDIFFWLHPFFFAFLRLHPTPLICSCPSNSVHRDLEAFETQQTVPELACSQRRGSYR